MHIRILQGLSANKYFQVLSVFWRNLADSMQILKYILLYLNFVAFAKNQIIVAGLY